MVTVSNFRWCHMNIVKCQNQKMLFIQKTNRNHFSTTVMIFTSQQQRFFRLEHILLFKNSFLRIIIYFILFNVLGQIISLYPQNIMKYLVFQDMLQIKTLKKHITSLLKNIIQMQIKVIKLLRKNFKKSPMHMRRLFTNKFGMIHPMNLLKIFIKQIENINMVVVVD